MLSSLRRRPEHIVQRIRVTSSSREGIVLTGSQPISVRDRTPSRSYPPITLLIDPAGNLFRKDSKGVYHQLLITPR